MSLYKIEIEVIRNDVLYPVYMQCRNPDGTGANLTNWTEIRLFVYEKGATSSKINTTNNITIDNILTGLLHYFVQPGDFDVANKRYEVEIQVTFTGGKIVTFRGLKIIVLPEAPS